jgi:mono/diheme cytochrome c family protein
MFFIILLFTILVMIGCPDKKSTQSFIEENYSLADLVRGGQLYDKWWKINGQPEPTSDFDPIWSSQSTNSRSGSTTWRCKECHGWDYVGLNGRYSSGSHYTGFKGVWDQRNEHMEDVFDAIKGEGGEHDLSAVLSDGDLVDLTKFILEGLVDMGLYIGPDGMATGSTENGKSLYNDNDNPQETLHKIRWGHPGSSPSMPSAVVDGGLSDSETGDILAYAQTLPGSVKLEGADMKQGGQLYDKWWKVNGQPEPTTDFDPIWASQSTNTRSGSTTWRCKECHGWDYIGLDGRYSSGSHYTGFAGVWDARNNSDSDIFNAIKGAGGDHDLSDVLGDDDIWNLTSFITGGLVDMGLYIGPDGMATGSAANGQQLYDDNCSSCHGLDGDAINFHGDENEVQAVGWLANDNPQETLHKIRWGHPGSNMPSAVIEGGLSDDETGDILAYTQTLPGSVKLGNADMKRGGLLYDKWWKVNGQPEPTTDFDPIWASQSTNTRSGSTTWRCKECHGWDYIGLDGRYSSGSHYTGFEGVWEARNNNDSDIFNAIKNAGGDHDLSSVLDDDDIWDLTSFITSGLVDMGLYIGPDGMATGSAANGEVLFNASCVTCHGADGNTIDFDDGEDGIQGVGWLANDNPQETLHKIRWGHPGSSMTSAVVDGGLTDDETGDILAYAQSLE